MTKLTDVITLAHGNGGLQMRDLIDQVFLAEFDNEYLNKMDDAARLSAIESPVITTDGYTVDPLFFPGGNIGKLAICGTLNDLLVSFATPKYMTCSYFIEEGFALPDLKKIAKSMALEAKNNHVKIVAGDTKVLPRGSVNGVFISTTGVGSLSSSAFNRKNIRSGDVICTSGTLGDHGAAILLARNEYDLSGDIESDCATVLNEAKFLWQQDGLRYMRDPTRGGVATVCHEILHETGLGIVLDESKIPVREDVRGYCEILGFDPLYLACEGRIIFVMEKNSAENCLTDNQEFQIIGEIDDSVSHVLLQTELGGKRIIPELDADPLPRIC